jgi:outer membrane protein assembly factor BamD (BamD/ComL family)
MTRSCTILLAALLVFAAGCSKQKESDLMSQAMKLAQGKKYDEAMKLYQQVADEYPDSRSAPMALYAKALIQLNDLKAPEEAIKTFTIVVEKYANSEFAHKSLFMTGFVEANTLRRLAKAKEHYKAYLTKYRDSSMAETARFELDHLGMSPEEVLKDVQDTTRSSKPKPFVHP